MPADGKQLDGRYEKLREHAAQHFRVCDEMAPYIAPSRVGILSARTPGTKQNRQVFDSTTMVAAELLAYFVSSYSMNPSQMWGGMRPRLQDATEELQEWFEDSRDRMMADFAASMFYSEGVEALTDWSGFGTGCLMTDEAPSPVNRTVKGWRGSHYEAHKTGRFVIADGPDGLVDTVMYDKVMSARMMEVKFGREQLPEKVKQSLATDPDKAFTVLHAIYPRPLSESRYAAGARKLPYASCWVERESKQVVRESGYSEFPGAVPRYSRTPGEIFGRGRGHLAFPDTWSLNALKRMSFEDLALKTKPPVLLSHDAVLATLRLTPGGPTPINTHGRAMRDVIAPWETGSHPEVTSLKEEELRKSIRQTFFVDQILMMMEVNKSEMTAFEFAKKMELLFRLLGPVYGRQRKEFMERIWQVKFVQMWEAGAFAPPPPELLSGEAEYDIVFENPMERAQRSGDVEAINFAVQDLLPHAQIDPTVWDWFGRDALVQHVFKVRGVPARVSNSPQQVAAIRQARQQQETDDVALEQAGQIAESAGKVAPLLTALQGGQRA